MNRTKSYLIIFLAVLAFLSFSCKKQVEEEKEIDEPIEVRELSDIREIFYNLPISNDTILIDNRHNISFRVEMEGYLIDSVIIILNHNNTLVTNNIIFQSRRLFLWNVTQPIKFKIRAINNQTRETIYFQSKEYQISAVEDLSRRYVIPTVEDGRLKLTWPELDKKDIAGYEVIRYMGDEGKYKQEFVVQAPSFIDHYYVGEEASYKITVLKKDGLRQDIWYYRKSREEPTYSLHQNPTGGYTLHYSKCKYYNNLGTYILEDIVLNGMIYVPVSLKNSTNAEDTTWNFQNAPFLGQMRCRLKSLPKEYPPGVSDSDYILYSTYFISSFGLPYIRCEYTVSTDVNTLFLKSQRTIYKFNTNSNQTISSYELESGGFEVLNATPGGKYIYAGYWDYSGYFMFIWPSASFPKTPDFVLPLHMVSRLISDNLITLVKYQTSDKVDKFAIYDIANSTFMTYTDIVADMVIVNISTDGKYFIFGVNTFKLFGHINNKFEFIYEHTDSDSEINFSDFDPQNSEICYTYDKQRNFSIRNSADFRVINSFRLDTEGIINICYHTKRILGYNLKNFRIYNLNNGNLVKEIPVDHFSPVTYGVRLNGNTIYANNGVRFLLNSE